MDTPIGALAGIRVVDFSWAVAGPLSTALLAHLGAEVIKVESRTHPDMVRRPDRREAFRDPSTPGGLGSVRNTPIFDAVNRQKRGITLNLGRPEGIALAKKLVAISDVVVENFRPGVMDRLGLGYDDLRALRPDIIMLSCSFFGSKHPQSRYSGYAPLFAAVSGLGDISGYPDGPPVELHSTVDAVVGFTNATALLTALVHRQTHGVGQHIDVSCAEAAACMLSDALLDYTATGHVQRRCANDDEPMAPHNCYRCQGEDSWVSIAVGTEDEWRALCRVVGAAWTNDPRFRTPVGRWNHRNELDVLLEGWTVERTAQQVTELLQGSGVATMPCYDAPSLLWSPHAAERGVVAAIATTGGEARLLVDLAGKLSLTPQFTDRLGPSLGEHNQYVLGHLLGLDAEEIAKLDQDGVLY